VQVVAPAEGILAHYRHREGERRFVWPVLDRYVVDPAWDLSGSDDMQRALNSRSGKMTRDLSTIEDEAGLSTHITMHVARHTFARKAMDGGWTLQEIQAALGHKQISTTESYLRTLRDDELDEQHRDLF
jgi:integrase/recombinase XerD